MGTLRIRDVTERRVRAEGPCLEPLPPGWRASGTNPGHDERMEDHARRVEADERRIAGGRLALTADEIAECMRAQTRRLHRCKAG